MGIWREQPGVLPCAVAAVIALLCAGCASTTDTPAPSARGPLPAGSAPSAISRMVCSTKALKELDDVLGVTGTVSTPAWSDHTYSCHYRYARGSFALTVKELSSWPQTYAYFGGLGGTLGNTGKTTGLGQAAFTTNNGAVVVRKDWKVLTVDISGLPPQFGVPPTSAADTAYTIADVIMGCWNGD